MRRALRLVLPSAVAAVLSACSLFGSDTPKPKELTAIEPSLAARVVWSHSGGDVGFALQIATAGDRFVVADEAGRVVALQAQDGAELWRGEVGAKLSAGVGSDGRFAAVVTRDQELVVLDAGREVWRKRLGAPVYTAPLVAGERVFVLGVDRAVHAFDVLDGRRLWELRRPGDALLLAQPGGLMAYKDTLVVGQGARLAGVDPLRGVLRWEANVANPRGTNEVERLGDLVAPLARVGDLVCARAFQAAVGCVNAQRGSLVWSRPSGGAKGVGADADVAVGFDASDRLTAWRLSNGETLWTNEEYQHRQLSAALVMGGQVVLGDLEGQVHFLAIDTGKASLRLPTGGSAIVAGPVRAGNTLLVVAKNGGVHALRLE